MRVRSVWVVVATAGRLKAVFRQAKVEATRGAAEGSRLEWRERPPMEIPWADLSPEALHGVVEEFVTREGTEYGLQTYTLDQKIAQVLAQLRSGRASIEYDPDLGSCTIVEVHR